ncbi:MAG: peptidoglycan DD-metalloendopeptidase family protein, partial [Candidatus Marinimicrobia bacterium]|nr:peptidoglycan DD-metalloendopeptidase family protein [Candidatus Neomarinimicrobiota bacterium]
MAGSKQHILIYIPGKNSREFSFSRFSFVFLTVLCGLLLLGIVAGSAFIGYKFVSPYFYSSDTIRNKTLLKTVEDLRAELQMAEAYLDSMVELNNTIRLYADMPQHDLSIDNLGIGGRVQMADPASTKNVVEELEANVEFLGTKVSVELENYKNLYADIQKYKKRLQYIPAITPLKTDSYYISSNYGYRIDPFTEETKYHSGIDLAANRGTPVHASGNGKVIYASYSYGGYGNVVKVDHGYGFVTVYAHLNRIKVEKGDTVERGALLGEVGSTGRSTGPHLHYEVQKDGKPVNPSKYMWDDKSL